MPAKPKKASGVRVRVDGPPDLTSRVISKLSAFAPRSEAKKAEGMLEIARISENLLSEIRFVLRTDNTPYDDIIGGFPIGRVCEVYGLEASGKTALMLRTAIKAQIGNVYEITRSNGNIAEQRKLDPSEFEMVVAYFDNEQSLDNDNKLTVDGVSADFAVGNADTVDLLFKGIEGVISIVTERQAELDEKKGSTKLVFGVIIVDTIAATSSAQELAMDWGKEDYARQPQQISRGFRRIVRKVNRNNVCLICTNQVRDKIGESGMGGKRGMPKSPIPQAIEYTTFGGRALRFYATHRIFMYSLPRKYRLVPKAKLQAGLLIGFYAVKNRIRQPLRDGRMVLLFDNEAGGLNDVFSILETLIHMGFAEVSNPEDGTDIVFKFNKNKVPTTTFGTANRTMTLEEADELPPDKLAKRSRVKDPSIGMRADWPAFYAEHRADFDALWSAMVKYVFTTQGLKPDQVPDEDDETSTPED